MGYERGARIAPGGAAAVHVGTLSGAAGFRRAVAIKRLDARHACDATQVRRFVAEARAGARVRHPNVVPVLDLVDDDGVPAIVMELVVGSSLDELLRTCRALGDAVPPAIARAIAVAVLRGLRAAHASGVVHGDVTARRVLVGEDGAVRIGGFGARSGSAAADVAAALALVPLQAALPRAAADTLVVALEATPLASAAEIAAWYDRVANASTGDAISVDDLEDDDEELPTAVCSVRAPTRAPSRAPVAVVFAVAVLAAATALAFRGAHVREAAAASGPSSPLRTPRARLVRAWEAR